jgi:hypothetical protein
MEVKLQMKLGYFLKHSQNALRILNLATGFTALDLSDGGEEWIVIGLSSFSVVLVKKQA